MAEGTSSRVNDTAAESQESDCSSSAVPERRKCLLVLGMHRSGTSALSGLLANLGAQRPKRELPPQADNQLGFFEPSEVVAIHDRFLAALSSNWFDWRALPADWRRSRSFEYALGDLEAAVRHDFDGHGTFLVKDPRICRFVDLWIALAERMQAELVVLHIFRSPLEVASSLRVRNGFDEAQSHLLWLRHVLEAESATRKIPRAFVSYDGLLLDGLQEVERALRFVEVGIDADSVARSAADKFVDPALKRQAVGSKGASGALGCWTGSAHSMLDRLRQTPNDRTALKALDKLRSEFDSGCEAFGPIFATASVRTHELQQDILRLRTVEEEREVLVRSLRTVSWAADRVPTLEAELESARNYLSELSKDVRRMTEIDREFTAEREKSSGFETIAARVPELERHLTAARSQLEVMEKASQESAGLLARAVAERDRLGAELNEQLAARDAQLARMRIEVATLSWTTQRVPILEAEIAAIQTEMGDEKRRHADARGLADLLPGAQADCARLNAQLVEAEIAADRIPHLEKTLADVKARADLLAQKLGSRKELLRRLVFRGV